MKDEQIEKRGFKIVLKEEILKNKIMLAQDMLKKLEEYKELLLEWNEKFNLTAITNEYEIIIKHFVDSLECVKYISEGSKVIDIGTGCGFPGLVLAIYFDKKIEVTLVDSQKKRLTFLQEVINKLKLKNVIVVLGRAEELGQKREYREKYDIAVSRAVAGLPVLLEYDVPFVKVNGKCLLMKGDNINEEIKLSEKALQILNCKVSNIYKYEYQIYDEQYNRTIAEIMKKESTPKAYPRNYGRIKKQNL